MKKLTRPCRALLVLGISLWLAGGCAPRRSTPRVAAPAPARVPGEASQSRTGVQPPSGKWILEQYTDLPIPKGYKLKAEDSFVFMQGTLRSVDLKYEGDRSEQALVRFYQESMPTHGWQFLRMTGVKMKTLTYVKGIELCEIIIMLHKPRRGESGEEARPLTHLHIKMNPY
jgi:hypothetical protein